MNYAQLEDDIVARLAPIVTAGHQVEAMPSYEALNTKLGHEARITVQVGMAKGDTEDIQSQSSTSNQYEDVYVEVIIRSKRLRSNNGEAGVYDLSELARKLLMGWRSSQSWMPFVFVDLAPLSPENIVGSVFNYSLRMKTRAMLRAEEDPDVSVLVEQITILPNSVTGPLIPTAELFASAYSVLTSGDQITLAWITNNADSVDISGGGLGEVVAVGSATVTITTDTTFVLTATRGAEVASVSVLVTVGTSCADVTEQVNGVGVGATASGGTNNQVIEDTLGNPVGTAANPSVVGNVTVDNSDSTVSVSVKAEGSDVFPDTPILVNSDLVVNQPSGIAKDVVVRYLTQGVAPTTVVSGDIVVPDQLSCPSLTIGVYSDIGLTNPITSADFQQVVYIQLHVVGITATEFRFMIFNASDNGVLYVEAGTPLTYTIASFNDLLIYGEATDGTDVASALTAFELTINADVDANAFIAKHDALSGLTMAAPQRELVQWTYQAFKGTGTTFGSDLWSKMVAYGGERYMFLPVSSSVTSLPTIAIDWVDVDNPATIVNFIPSDVANNGVTGGLGKRLTLKSAPSGFSQNNNGVWGYPRTALAGGSNVMIGAGNNNITLGTATVINASTNQAFMGVNQTSVSVVASVGTGLHIAQRAASGSSQFYIDNVLVHNSIVASQTPSTFPIYGFGYNQAGVLTREFTGKLIGLGVDPSWNANERADMKEIMDYFALHMND